MRRRTRQMRIGLALVIGATASWAGLPAAAHAGVPTSIPPGFDLFETDPAGTALQFSQSGGTAIPGGFFDPGCSEFTGTVNFGGVPLERFGGESTGDADTVVERLGTADLGNPAANVPIEIVALSLQSMQPITVQCGDEQQRWQIDVSPSESQQQGQIQIIQQTPEGGVFNSFLPVTPLLTFTRIGDASQARVLDAADLGPQVLNRLTFVGQNSVWRAGCIEPALAIPRLNSDFCPGQTPDGEKMLTPELALLASHGVYPVQPALEHFQCYKLTKRSFRKRKVSLNDQFASRNAKVKKRAELCNPAQKNDEPFSNKRAHLTRYQLSGPRVGSTVATLNQFGSQSFVVGKPKRLMVPSEKQETGGKRKRIETQIDHFQCYSVKAQTGVLSPSPRPKKVKLTDQFRGKRVKVKGAKLLCAPVDKNDEGVLHPVRHLLCYAIKTSKRSRKVKIRNQFERRVVKTVKPKELCVPTSKQVLR